MINIVTEQTAIKNYIESNLATYTGQASLTQITNFIDDFLDFDKYKYTRCIYYDFSDYSFSGLSNESETEKADFSIYIVLRGNAADKTDLIKYATAFYSMFQNSGLNFGGAVDNGSIESMEFYNWVEGTPNVKLVEITIHTEKEI